MEKVFTRWPSPAQASALTEQGNGFPRWMLSPSVSQRPEQLGRLARAAFTVLFPALFAFAAGISFATPNGVAVLLIAIAALSVVAAATYATRLLRTLAESKARYEAIFERAGIS